MRAFDDFVKRKLIEQYKEVFGQRDEENNGDDADQDGEKGQELTRDKVLPNS